MMLFYGEALKREAHARADLIGDINAGFRGGDKAEQLIRKLRHR